MISRRNYFAITVIMAVVFFLFQFINVARDSWNNYEVNPYVKDREELPGREDAYGLGQESRDDYPVEETDAKPNRGEIVYIGDEAGKTGCVAKAWAVYTKRGFRAYGTLQQYETGKEETDTPEMILLDSGSIDWEQAEELVCLETYLREGSNLVFCNLPEASLIGRNRRLRDFLGIQEVRSEETTVEGVHLYKGFLLGGETIYRTEDEEENEKRQDMELTFPWYILGTGTKPYMKGIPEDETLKLEERPGIIWRKSFADMPNTYLFAVNGSYMEDVTGIGLLSAMAAETKYYEIYPVVNAQNLVVANYPGYARENEQEMERLYSQSMETVFRDIIWPDLISVYQRNQLGLSCMIAPQFDYEDDNVPKRDMAVNYMKLLNEQMAEGGLSCINMSDTDIGRKLAEDRAFMQEALPDYQFTSLYVGNLPQGEIDSALGEEWLGQVRTVVTGYTEGEEVIGFCSENVTKQSALTDGFKHTYREDFRLKSVETALGYSNVTIDINEVAYSGDGEDTWKDISKDFGWNIKYYWAPFRMFEGTTVSQSDERIRNFLALDYREERENSVISLEISGLHEPVWFILRTKDETIENMEGGIWQRLEENAYLLKVENEKVSLEMRPDRYLYKYDS